MKNKIVIMSVALIAIAAGGFILQNNLATKSNPAIESANATVATGDDKIHFQLKDVTGELRQSSEWDGKARLINFWATWCAPCRREIPLLIATQEKYAANNVQIIGIAVDFPDEVAAYAEEAEFNYPILVGQEDAMAVAESSGVDFIGLPFTMVISPDGDLIKTHIGEIVEAHIEKITTVLAQMERGDLNLEGAREALKTL
ncbi:MAG: TlpA family protein disulfide reductase [Gammaproteobacteria bacterium]|nr:TlpA family protein disulfide reductase [Gammaproteobacteria bacterium]